MKTLELILCYKHQILACYLQYFRKYSTFWQIVQCLVFHRDKITYPDCSFILGRNSLRFTIQARSQIRNISLIWITWSSYIFAFYLCLHFIWILSFRMWQRMAHSVCDKNGLLFIAVFEEYLDIQTQWSEKCPKSNM